MRDIVIYGAGGFAREVAWLVATSRAAGEQVHPVAFVDDREEVHGSYLNDLPIMGLDAAHQRYPSAGMIVAVGTPGVRRRLSEKATEIGFQPVTCVAPDVRASERVELGEGVVICAGNILTTNIELADGVQINLDCTIGHDVVMGEFTTLAPGVHVSGWVHFGPEVYVGTGAVFVNGTSENPLTVGAGAVIGAGACVTRSVDAGVTVVGVPAKPT